MLSFDVFTPTHNSEHLQAAYTSLCAQTHTRWCWYLVPNRDAVIPDTIAHDPRVKVIPVKTGGIGALKRLACEQGTGDILVELDHDDLLTKSALAVLAQTAARSPQPGQNFYYSDFINVDVAGAPLFTEAVCQNWQQTGWEFYLHHERRAARAFAPEPRSLCEVHYAPNHVRAWDRALYTRIGGHDASLEVCDDQDLICRTYLAGAALWHIPQPLYLYREHANSYKAKHEQIVLKNRELCNQYLPRLIEEWCRREQLHKVDLGAAHGTPAGYRGLDCQPGPGVDQLTDLRQPWPLDSNSVGVLRAHDFVEHLAPGAEIIHFWNEAYRVLAPGGWLDLASPSTGGRGAWQDPTHKSGWNPNSFWYVSQRKFRDYVAGLQPVAFQATQVWEHYPSEWHRAHQVLYVQARLLCLKGQRYAGPRFQ
jgi:predicted SAM-dependent methyltransferase